MVKVTKKTPTILYAYGDGCDCNNKDNNYKNNTGYVSPDKKKKKS